MTVYIEKEAQNLREELAALRARVAMGMAQEAFWFSGTGAQTAFALPRGWKPKFVYVDGALRRQGGAFLPTLKRGRLVAASVAPPNLVLQKNVSRISVRRGVGINGL
ncbi:MAG: hypothetical protein VXZ18_18380, partial [Pseudomonadota bacterium]|nr:hypothetical protein [Pseudomonadota bacterium]